MDGFLANSSFSGLSKRKCFTGWDWEKSLIFKVKLYKNIFFVFSAVLILLPPVVSFSHIFTDHSHKLCDNYAEHHYHAKSIDCELHKFHKNPALSISFPKYILVPDEHTQEEIFDYYQFLNEYEPLNFYLRGPPCFA